MPINATLIFSFGMRGQGSLSLTLEFIEPASIDELELNERIRNINATIRFLTIVFEKGDEVFRKVPWGSQST